MKVLVVGAGGLGGFLGAALARAGHEVHLVARGEHRERIVAGGLRVHDPAGDFTVQLPCTEEVSAGFSPEVTFVTVKTHSLDGVIPQLRVLAERGSLVIPLLNGVDAGERLRGGGLSGGGVALGVAYLTAFRIAPGEVERKGAHARITLGAEGREARDGTALGALHRTASALASAGIESSVIPDISVELWRKMILVSALSGVCGLTRAPLGPIRKHLVGRSLLDRAVVEAASVARASGVGLPKGEEEAVMARLDAFRDDFYPSLLHDLRQGAPTEVASLSGEVVRRGRQEGIATPVHEAALCAIELADIPSPSSTAFK